MAGTHIKFDRPVPAIVQDFRTGQVLMVGYMDQEAYAKTLETGLAWFWSRSRGRLWQKGETSGNVLRVKELRYDCDGDAILLLVDPAGPACHTGQASCFFNKVDLTSHVAFGPVPAPSFGPGEHSLSQLAEVIRQRHREMPERSYTAYLLREGVDKISKKLGEEAVEVVVAAKNGVKQRIVEEMADLLYHALVMLEASGVDISEVYAELAERAAPSLEAGEEPHDH